MNPTKFGLSPKFITLLTLLLFAIVAQAQIPSGKLVDVNGNTVEASTLSNGGKPFVVVYYYLTNCGPCIKLLLDLNREYSALKSETGLCIYFVNIEDTESNDAISKRYPNLASNLLKVSNSKEYGQKLDAIGINSVPAILFYDGKGNKTYQQIGYSSAMRTKLLQQLRDHMKISNNNNSDSNNLNNNQHTSYRRTSNPIVIKHVHNADHFSAMYQNLIGLPYDFRDSNIDEIKSYCRSNGYVFTVDDSDVRLKWIKVSNPVTEIFGLNFKV